MAGGGGSSNGSDSTREGHRPGPRCSEARGGGGWGWRSRQCATAGEAICLGARHGDGGGAPGGARDTADAVGAGSDVVGGMIEDARRSCDRPHPSIVRQTTEATSVDVVLR